MKPDNELILNFFTLFADLPDQELAKWRGLCENAGSKIFGMRKKGTDIKRNMERLCAAAAACAYCDYVMISGGINSSDEIRVGDISLKNVSGNDAIKDAEGMREHFLADISDLIDLPTGFVFKASECAL